MDFQTAEVWLSPNMDDIQGCVDDIFGAKSEGIEFVGKI